MPRNSKRNTLPRHLHLRTVQLVRTDAPAPRVVDLAGNALMDEQTINAIKLDPTKMPDAAGKVGAVVVFPESLYA